MLPSTRVMDLIDSLRDVVFADRITTAVSQSETVLAGSVTRGSLGTTNILDSWVLQECNRNLETDA